MASASHNVTLADDLKEIEQSIPCFLCHDPVEIRRDKHQKPYFVCEKCGVQAFIRRKAGMCLLMKLHERSFSNLGFIQLARELRLLKSEDDKLSHQQGIPGLFAPDPELIKAREVIGQKIKEISEQIKESNK